MPESMHRLICIATLAALAIATPAQAASPARYLLGARNADGGFGMTPSAGSTPFATGWATLGLAAAGHRPSGATVVYVRRGLGSVRAIGDVERTILVVRAAHRDPRRFGGRNLIADAMRHRHRDGSFGGYVSYTSFGILALRRSAVSRSSGTIRAAARWLARRQNADGGFSVAGSGASTIDDTGYAVQALVAAGRRRSAAVRRAASVLARWQRRGAWPLTPGGAPNAQSTAYAAQALIAAGGHAAGVNAGLRYLRSLTEPSGLVRYSRTSRATPVWVTAQALMALSRRTF